MNTWCKLACLSLIFIGLWLMLWVRIIMQFIKFMVVTQMFLWKAKNVHVFTIGRKVCKYTQRIWYFLLFRNTVHWMIFASNGYIPQLGRNLRWIMQGLKLGGMIKGQQFLPMFLNFNNSYVGGLKSQHIWLITLWMNLTLRSKLWCQQPISLRVSILPCGFLLTMDISRKQICTLPLWMTWWGLCCNNNFIICWTI